MSWPSGGTASWCGPARDARAVRVSRRPITFVSDVVGFVVFPLHSPWSFSARGGRGIQVVIEDSFLPLLPKADVAASVDVATYEQRGELLPVHLQQGGSSGHLRNMYRTFSTFWGGMNTQCDTILSNATLVQLMQVFLKPR